MGLVHGTPVQVFQCTMCTYICLERAQSHMHFNRDHRTINCNFCSLGFQLQSQLDKHISEKHPEVTVADTADTAIVAPQMAPPSPQLPVPAPAPTSTLPVPVPALTPEPSADTTDEQTDMPDMSTSSEPTLDTTGTDTTEVGQHPTNRSTWKCEACSMFFINNDLRLEHIRIYHRDLIVSCRFCRRLRFSLTMGQHLQVSHAICSAGSKVFANHELLQAHHQQCQYSRPNVTLTTDTDVMLDPALAASSTPHPGDKETQTPPVQEKATGSPGRSSHPYVCSFCKKGFEKLPALNMHKAQKHKFKVVLTHCPDCLSTFSSLPSMQQHHMHKHKLKEFHCDMSDCDYFCYSAEELNKHRRRDHRSYFKFRCSKCHFVSVTSAELWQHSAEIHSSFYLPPQENVDQCWSLYFDHIRTHPQNKFACDECPFVFSSPQVLNTHCVSAHDTSVSHAYIVLRILLVTTCCSFTCENTRCNVIYAKSSS